MEEFSSGKIGRYEIISILGRGTAAEVILAQDENLRRRVAIKRPYRTTAAQFRFEARAASLLHPNIPAVYEIGMDDDLPFIAMEYVDGETLQAIIDSGREFDLIAKLRSIEQVCLALSYAHEHGILHGNIRPDNIIVRPDGTAKIICFGISRGGGDADLQFAGGERVDGRADVRSAGVTLFNLLTDQEPFTVPQSAAGSTNETPAQTIRLLRDLPSQLQDIAVRSLARNPDDGFQTAEEFADALHAVIKRLVHIRVTGLFQEVERLAAERRFAAAVELLDEAMRLEPSSNDGRKLRKAVHEQQDRIRRAEHVAAVLLKSNAALRAGNFDEALSCLREAQARDPASPEIRSKIHAIEDAQRRFEDSARALAEAEEAKARGDIGGAMHLVNRALEEAPDDERLHKFKAVLIGHLEVEARRGRLLEVQEEAARALAARDFAAAQTLLREATAMDASDPDTGKLRRELARALELDQRSHLLDEIQQRVQALLESDGLDQAADVVNGALGKLPGEPLLHRLKAEVEAAERQYDVRRIVDLAIAQANELFPRSPLDALAIIEKMQDNIPGDERLLACESSLRQQLKVLSNMVAKSEAKKPVCSEDPAPDQGLSKASGRSA